MKSFNDWVEKTTQTNEPHPDTVPVTTSSPDWPVPETVPVETTPGNPECGVCGSTEPCCDELDRQLNLVEEIIKRDAAILKELAK